MSGIDSANPYFNVILYTVTRCIICNIMYIHGQEDGGAPAQHADDGDESSV